VGANNGRKPPKDARLASIALRMLTDLLAGLLVGFALGWGLDALFGTLPWFLIGFGLLGMAGGLRVAMQTAKEASGDSERG